MSNKAKLKISIKELVLYIICGAFILWGLTYVVLGLLAAYLPIAQSANPLYAADSAIRAAFGLGFLGWGLILACGFACVFAIMLNAFAKGTDKNVDKDQRRAARRAARLKATEETPVEE